MPELFSSLEPTSIDVSRVKVYYYGRYVNLDGLRERGTKPEQLVRVIIRSDGHEVPICSPPCYERVATKQASKREIREARLILEHDPSA